MGDDCRRYVARGGGSASLLLETRQSACASRARLLTDGCRRARTSLRSTAIFRMMRLFFREMYRALAKSLANLAIGTRTREADSESLAGPIGAE
jgi:hypothetical protein